MSTSPPKASLAIPALGTMTRWRPAHESGRNEWPGLCRHIEDLMQAGHRKEAITDLSVHYHDLVAAQGSIEAYVDERIIAVSSLLRELCVDDDERDELAEYHFPEIRERAQEAEERRSRKRDLVRALEQNKDDWPDDHPLVAIARCSSENTAKWYTALFRHDALTTAQKTTRLARLVLCRWAQGEGKLLLEEGTTPTEIRKAKDSHTLSAEPITAAELLAAERGLRRHPRYHQGPDGEAYHTTVRVDPATGWLVRTDRNQNGPLPLPAPVPQASDRDEARAAGDHDVGAGGRCAEMAGEGRKGKRKRPTDDHGDRHKEGGDDGTDGAGGEGDEDDLDAGLTDDGARGRDKAWCHCDTRAKEANGDGTWPGPCSAATREAIMTCPELKRHDQTGLAAAMKVASAVVAEKRAGKKVCRPHCRVLASRLGLITQGVKTGELCARFREFQAQGDAFAEWWSSDRAYLLFRKDARPELAADERGLLRFDVQHDPFDFPWDAARARAVLEEIAPGMYDTFGETGNVVYPLFAWWEPVGLMARFREEFRLYDHHLELRPATPHNGWLRNAYHTVTQQIMRMDPLYYLIHACLRPDANHNLVSYPYYLKLAKPGNETAFLHLDINITQALEEGQMGNCIQGSVSLSEENRQSCTVLLPKMHRRLAEYRDRLQGRGMHIPSSLANNLDDGWWTAEDEEFFQTRWQYVRCHAGDARTSHPFLPHGSSGPTTVERMTALPWFVGIRSDGQMLDHLRSGTVDDLRAAHAQLVPGPSSPSSKTNAYGTVGVFPAAVPVDMTHPLCLALVGHRPHSSTAVRQAKQALFASPREQRIALIRAIRTRLAAAAHRALDEVFRLEEAFYGSDSYARLSSPKPGAVGATQGSLARPGRAADEETASRFPRLGRLAQMEDMPSECYISLHGDLHPTLADVEAERSRQGRWGW